MHRNIPALYPGCGHAVLPCVKAADTPFCRGHERRRSSRTELLRQEQKGMKPIASGEGSTAKNPLAGKDEDRRPKSVIDSAGVLNADALAGASRNVGEAEPAAVRRYVRDFTPPDRALARADRQQHCLQQSRHQAPEQFHLQLLWPDTSGTPFLSTPRTGGKNRVPKTCCKQN